MEALSRALGWALERVGEEKIRGGYLGKGGKKGKGPGKEGAGRGGEVEGSSGRVSGSWVGPDRRLRFWGVSRARDLGVSSFAA